MKKHIFIIAIMCLLSIAITGCTTIKKLELKLGIRNESFEYMKNEREVKKLVIQSERDKGYRFEVTNKEVINDIAEILSKAKKTNVKSEFQNDYIIEVYEKGGTVKQYKYVAGLDKRYGGNFYSEEQGEIFIVSSRLDKDIIDNFGNIRKPIKFNEIYYDGILKAMDAYVKNNKYNKDKVMGIDLRDDMEIQKYMLSLDINDFQEKMKERYPFVKFGEKTSDDDYTLSVKTEGYTNKVYKMVLNFIDNKTSKEQKYYAWGTLDTFNDWVIKVFSSKPNDF
ncbi:hypothetical protein SAMN02745248_02321 [Hathewaya proteolytica DSM 3090]|uniref:YhfM-like domain-containing protein n=1 Tax=Hathewaya proteolytica DSM 3090 TaxID=1121331 RepID=A0A1M6RLU7_9CLOT|nr:hypothetical protein [Hathewaya proteolytica]SHK33328.1 hypothetical protein SAMN02745248_02321 [Hathewaya proteolytica DSM 3090]